MTPSSEEIMRLPGGDRMLQGLQDWRDGRTTVNSSLVVIAFGKFRAAGLVSGEAPFAQAELVLYDLLKKEGHNAYGRYNSLIRELVSFGRALARAQRGIRS
jgi:hypothetical protein